MTLIQMSQISLKCPSIFESPKVENPKIATLLKSDVANSARHFHLFLILVFESIILRFFIFFLVLLIPSNQAWAKIIYMRAMIYLNMKKLHARAENLYNSPVYSLDFYPSTKFFWDQHVTYKLA